MMLQEGIEMDTNIGIEPVCGRRIDTDRRVCMCVREGHMSVTGSRLRWSAVISVIGFIALATVRELLLHARSSTFLSLSLWHPIVRVRERAYEFARY